MATSGSSTPIVRTNPLTGVTIGEVSIPGSDYVVINL